MTDPAIKAALVAAEDAALREAWRNRGHTDEAPVADMREANRWGAWNDAIKGAPAAVAAFLRALPTAWVRDTYGSDEAVFKNLMLEAVARAAQEARDA